MVLINRILWLLTTVVIIFSSIYFSFELKFPQLKLKKILKSLKMKSDNNIRVIDTLMMSLSSRIGVGSIAGIALAIKYGGLGSIFWIWIITILISSISYLESFYGNKYKTEEENGNCIGGPHHYIEKVLNKRKLALVYAFIIVIAYGIGFITIQTNTISTVTRISTNLNIHLINGMIIATSIYCLYSNSTKKTKLISKIVPIMTLLYLGLGMFITISDLSLIIDMLKNIFIEAINPESIAGGIIYSLIIGMQRAIFSTEVSIGTSAIASSTTQSDSKNQGYVEILGNYITTFLICTTTAIIILSSDFTNYINNSSNGIELAYYAFRYHFGNLGEIFILLFIILFAYSTILSGFYYGESSLKFMTKSKIINNLYKIIVIIFIMISTYISATDIWTLIDISVAILSLINLYSLIKIYKLSNN